ncbi:MAG: secretion system protein [Natrialbaceae archaeon]|nr:secretion system protein [Natrialbaceae archaeon]
MNPSEPLVEALAFIESEIEPETVVRAGYGLGILTVPVVAIALLLLVPWWSAIVVGLCAGICAIHAVHVAPRHLATLRRTRALGATPDLVARMVLRMHLEPTTESAVAFAAATGMAPSQQAWPSTWSRPLERHRQAFVPSPGSGLSGFLRSGGPPISWRPQRMHRWASEPERLTGHWMRRWPEPADQMATFTSQIRGPATGLFAFGVMLPLALVALVPAAAVAGYAISVRLFAVFYLVVLPILLVLVGAWLLGRRPVAFPPPNVLDPDRGFDRSASLLWVLVSVGACSVSSSPQPSQRCPPSPSASGLVSISGIDQSRSPEPGSVRSNLNLPDGLSLVGQHVGDGMAVEAAIELAGKRVTGGTGTVFAEAANLQGTIPLDVERAFLGQWGVLRDVPSPRTRGMATLLGTAATEGRPAGLALVRMADHLQDLQHLERETRRELVTVTGTLDSTATVFAPLVAGSTVALGATMAGVGVAGTDHMAVNSLSVAVGGYVVLLAVILTTISVGLRYGLDRPLVGYRVGRSLTIAMPLYVASIVAVGAIV